jgi:hypothetical protein
MDSEKCLELIRSLSQDEAAVAAILMLGAWMAILSDEPSDIDNIAELTGEFLMDLGVPDPSEEFLARVHACFPGNSEAEIVILGQKN